MTLRNLLDRNLVLLLCGGALAALLSGCLSDPVARAARERTEAFDFLTHGQRLKNEGDFLLAKDEFLRGIDVSPRPVLFYEVGNSYYHLGRFDEAVAWYDRALEERPDYELARAEKELASNGIGPNELNSEVANLFLLQNQESSRSNSTFLPGASMITSAIGEGEGTDEILMPTDFREDIFPELFLYRTLESEELDGFATRAMGGNRYSDAVGLYRELLRREPENGPYRTQLGKALMGEGRLNAGGEQLILGVRYAPSYAEAHFELGNYYLDKRDKVSAEASYEEALRLDPEHLKAANNLGVLALERGEYSNARGYFQSVVDRDGDFTAALLNLTLAMEGEGEPVSVLIEALEDYLRRINDTDLQAEKWLRSLRREAAGSLE